MMEESGYARPPAIPHPKILGTTHTQSKGGAARGCNMRFPKKSAQDKDLRIE